MGRIPGPTCSAQLGDDWIDPGTMCRAQSSPPGPSPFTLTPSKDAPLVCERNADDSFPDATIAPKSAPQLAIAEPIVAHRLVLQDLVASGRISKKQASKKFHDFIKKQVYSNQLEQGGAGFCACASRQMALKHAGIIRLGLSYAQIKRGLRNETSSNATKPGQWEYWHFNENVKNKSGKVFFSHESKLHPAAITQIAQNANVGTGSIERLRWTELTPLEARRFLDEGAMVVVGTVKIAHWMTAVHDPFLDVDLFVDPMSEGAERVLQDSDRDRMSMSHPSWGGVVQYHGLVRE
jgi:hypothetical protein